MFCPGCGVEEFGSNQFCRSCGSDLRAVRLALEKPDAVTASAASAREEIGRAVAARIREVKSAKELAKVTEEVLPEIEKFLESPEEKRLRRLRAGTIVSSLGVGAATALSVAAVLMRDADIFLLAGLGVMAFFIGIGLIINALLFTIPGKRLPELHIENAGRRKLFDGETNELVLPEPAGHAFTSVTEHTTRHLKEKDRVPRD